MSAVQLEAQAFPIALAAPEQAAVLSQHGDKAM